MASIVSEETSAPGTGTVPSRLSLPDGLAPGAWGPAAPVAAPVPSLVTDLAPDAADLADLDDPTLVLSDGYVGPDRRGRGPWATVRRVTFAQRRSLLRLEAVVALLAVVAVVALIVLEPNSSHRGVGPTVGSVAKTHASATGPTTVHGASTATPTPAPSASSALAPASAAIATPTTTTPPTTTPTTAPPAAAPVSAAPMTPAQMGAEALALVRYPWQSIPGYSIQFEPISAAPSPGFYGNTTFTWGHAGGTSVLYVYPGETVERLAGITAFEIAHEVDAAAVQPQGGETQIEDVLGIHPTSWAPNCDCAEQGFLSGWYAAAFSNYWSPGVGNWSQLAPLPTGPVLAAVEPWFNPSIP